MQTPGSTQACIPSEWLAAGCSVGPATQAVAPASFHTASGLGLGSGVHSDSPGSPRAQPSVRATVSGPPRTAPGPFQQ